MTGSHFKIDTVLPSVENVTERIMKWQVFIDIFVLDCPSGRLHYTIRPE